MVLNDFSAQEALAVLLERLHERDPDLEARVRSAIDAGHDLNEQQVVSGTRRMTSHVFRKTTAFTYEQALNVALQALRAYFVEQPLFINSVLQEFQHVPLTVHGDRTPLSAGGQVEAFDFGPETDKRIEIEIQTETSLLPTDPETWTFTSIPESSIREQQGNLASLVKLLDMGAV